MADAKISVREMRRHAAELEKFKPSPITDNDFGAIWEPRSFTLARIEGGLVAKFSDAEGRLWTIALNPVLAHQVSLAVLDHGHQAGWLDQLGELDPDPMAPIAEA